MTAKLDSMGNPMPAVGSTCRCGEVVPSKSKVGRHYFCAFNAQRTTERKFRGTKSRLQGAALQEHREAVRDAVAKEYRLP